MPSRTSLPSKICSHCGRSFNWRRKWRRDWDAVEYCSERCRRSSRMRGALR
ncbi:DUF2256 domain-containing protein [Cupriavidus basilensis]|uniref:DUF2256 domain-containing protein n=1 Tax=Cupriavidus basilensis TaxID=68895 RepID=UPI00283E3313|nr:DUF2256 domain-containing protein [Cupriavidus basilensis]MDR3381218.1 DUF2256 domain-containing protein [Cupriavidus basilensis]